MSLPDDDLADLCAHFLAAQKIISRQVRWRTGKRHADYAALRCILITEGERALRGTLALTAHLIRRPPKYGFALIYRGQRVLALDVNPGRFHRNLLTGGAVNETHWQRWPLMEAEVDSRLLTHNQWLTEFLTEANISCKVRLAPPPQGRQLGFDV